MKIAADKNCREKQNTRLILFFFGKVKKCGRARQATDDNTARAG
jgi:hypothetical protein